MILLVSCVTWNLGDWLKRPAEALRHRQIEGVLRELEPTVFFGQEFYSPPGVPIDTAVARLAGATDMHYLVPTIGKRFAVPSTVKGNHNDLGVAIMWRPPLEPVAGSWRVVKPESFWHALAGLTLVADGKPIDHFVYHGPPRVGREEQTVNAERVAEARFVASALTGTGANPLGMVCADWNTLGADRNPDGSYFHPDPEPAPMSDAAKWLARSRDAGEVLRGAGLVSAAAALGRPLTATSTGHEPPPSMKGTDYGSRLIDEAFVTPKLAAAVVTHKVIDTPVTRSLSDHLPVMIVYDTDRISR